MWLDDTTHRAVLKQCKRQKCNADDKVSRLMSLLSDLDDTTHRAVLKQCRQREEKGKRVMRVRKQRDRKTGRDGKDKRKEKEKKREIDYRDGDRVTSCHLLSLGVTCCHLLSRVKTRRIHGRRVGVGLLHQLKLHVDECQQAEPMWSVDDHCCKRVRKS